MKTLSIKAYMFMSRQQEKMKDARGASAVEYALLVSLIAVAIIGAVVALGGSLTAVFNKAASSISK
jgi:pilus assembly protein Flp/PilA